MKAFSIIICFAFSIILLYNCNNLDSKNVVRKYYPNGSLEKEFEVIKDSRTGKITLNGYSKSFYENGNLKSQGQYINGSRSGLFTFYFDNGTLKQKTNYSKGKVNGEFINYYKNGKLESIVHKINGIKNDTAIFYYENGQLQEKDLFQMGNLVYSISFTKDGKINDQKWYATFIPDSDSVKSGEPFRTVINVFEYNRLRKLAINLACVSKSNYDKDSANLYTKLRIQTTYYGEYFHKGYIYSCKVARPGIYYVTGDIEYIDPTGKENWTEVKHRFVVYP